MDFSIDGGGVLWRCQMLWLPALTEVMDLFLLELVDFNLAEAMSVSGLQDLGLGICMYLLGRQIKKCFSLKKA